MNNNNPMAVYVQLLTQKFAARRAQAVLITPDRFQLKRSDSHRSETFEVPFDAEIRAVYEHANDDTLEVSVADGCVTIHGEGDTVHAALGPFPTTFAMTRQPSLTVDAMPHWLAARGLACLSWAKNSIMTI